MLTALFLLTVPDHPEVEFRKTILDTRFVSEGVAVGDVDQDGKRDILAGNVWYKAPKWTPHEIAPYVEVDRKTQYSNCFHCWAADLNGDGWLDQIVIGMPGEKAVWRENPKGASGPWKEHLIWRSAGNESPHYVDLFGDGAKVLVMAYDDDYLAWFEPDPDPTKPWVCHNVSGLKGAGSQRYSHGLGVGDLDRDGRNEILTTGGYYRQFRDRWNFVKTDLGPDCAHMIVFAGTILTTSAHARGVWRFSGTGFERNVIDETISVTHAAAMAKLGTAGAWNLITGKRKWGHPPGVDIGSEEPCWLVRYETGADGTWRRHMIDEDSGAGTQIAVEDVNGDGSIDIATANKNGVFLFEQKGGSE